MSTVPAIRLVGTLKPSTNRGRYALSISAGQMEADLTAGMPVAVWMGHGWVMGVIEHGSGLYIPQQGGAIEGGYFFASDDGGRCGLCCGMRVGLL